MNPDQEGAPLEEEELSEPGSGGAFLAEDEGPTEARPVGTIEDQIADENISDPVNAQNPTLDEQQQYDDFVQRAILLISDVRQPEDGQPSPSDSTLKIMNNAKFTVPQAIGEAAANTTMMLHNLAKRAGVEYSPDVLFHGADELIAALYILGNAARIFDGVPPLKPIEEGEEAGEYDFDEKELAILEQAKMHAVERFGQMLVETGQIDEKQRKEASDFWKTQIEREIDSGEVGDDVLEGVNIDEARRAMASRMQGV